MLDKIKCVILDLDKTIIGDLVDISSYDTLINSFMWNNNLFESFKKIDDDYIMDLLQNGLLRPGIVDFIKHLYEKCKIKIVIYTLSERQWATRILNQIIKIIGYKFYTLLLCREDCIEDNKKSITLVIDKLNNLNIILEKDNFIMYDDNHTVETNLILVPKYNYKPRFNIFKELNPKLVKTSLSKKDYIQFIFTLKCWKYDIVAFENEHKYSNNIEFIFNDDFFINEINKFM